MFLTRKKCKNKYSLKIDFKIVSKTFLGVTKIFFNAWNRQNTKNNFVFSFCIWWKLKKRHALVIVLTYAPWVKGRPNSSSYD